MEQDQKTLMDDHRNMLMVSKNISEFQEKNLKAWPLIVFDDIDKVEISYNFINNKGLFFAGDIVFNIFFKGEEPNEKVKKQGLTALDYWTKILFYTDTKVNFKINGKKWT